MPIEEPKELIVEIDRGSAVPLYAQIVSRLREMIRSGVLKIGDRLPASRDFARLLGVNRNTVSTAYDELVADGLITSHVGRGTYISAVPSPDRKRSENTLSIGRFPWDSILARRDRDRWLGGMLESGGSPGPGGTLGCALPPAELLPIGRLRAALDRAIRKDGAGLFDLGDTLGYLPLREYLSDHLALMGIKAEPDEILITSGCQQALYLIRQGMLGPQDTVAVENPTYPGALSVFCGEAANVVTAPVGRGGLDLDYLEDTFARHSPALLYTTPTYHNPTGEVMDLHARRRLVELSLRYKVPIVEDDIYRELRYEGAAFPPLKALDRSGTVIHVSSFSKIGFPGIRVGWVAAARPLIEQLARVKRTIDLHTPTLNQALVFEFSSRGLLARHMKSVRAACRERRDAMLVTMDKYFPSGVEWNRPAGGMAIWVRLPDRVSAESLLVRSCEKGIIFCPASHFYAGAAPQNMMRMSFSTVPVARIPETIQALGALIETEMRKWSGPEHQPGSGFRAVV